MTDGRYIPEDKKRDARIIADGCRIAVELGADILKPPYPGNEPGAKEIFASICERSHVPVVMLGGAKTGDLRSVFETAQSGVEAGARGTIFGRNIWQRPVEQMERVVRGLQDVVHHGMSAEAAMRKHGLP
jgi:DhnA family fructose-bisphosphate aldolase class Ia